MMKTDQPDNGVNGGLPTDAEQAWQRRYEKGNTGWDRGAANPALDHWLARGLLSPPARVLIPGCGYGHEVLTLSQRGFHVTGVDIAPWPVQRLRARLREQQLDAQVVLADLLRWTPPEPFDAVYEQTFLCAIEPNARKQYAAWLGQWLRPGGHLLALFMQTDNRRGPPYHCDVTAMRALFPAASWRWPQHSDIEVAHPAGCEFGYALQLCPQDCPG